MKRLTILAAVLSSAFALAGCATDPARKGSTSFGHRGQIVPLVDHHQHVFGPQLSDPPTALLPEVQLPDDLNRLLRERERISGTRELGNLYAEDAMVLNIFFETDYWVRDVENIAEVVEGHGANAQFVPNAYSVDDSTAFISGIVHVGTEGEYDKHFSLGLEKDKEGAWRIASESITDKKANPFRQSLDARMLIMRLDDAGIQRAAVLSTAFWLANRLRNAPVAEQEAKTRAANDWVIAETALFPDRLVPFCSVSPLSEFAVAELERCAKLPRVKGMKLSFANGRVDLKNSGHLEKVRKFFRAANGQRMPIVVHLWPRGDAGPEYSKIFLEQVLPGSPDIPVQIAHMASGSDHVFDEVLGVFADAVAANDPRTRNLYFDLTEVVREETPEAIVQSLARRIRQIGFERILYGSDTPLPGFRPMPVQYWATFRRRIPLSDEELRAIADNVAPYMR